MGSHTIPRVALPREAEDVPPMQVGRWVLAGTPATEPYPCTCRYDPCRYAKCPDRTRNDLERVADRLPPGCCGRADAARPRQQVIEQAGFAKPDRRTTWERRFPTAQAAAPGMAENDLWDAPPDLADAFPAWDGLDDPSVVATEATEAPAGHSDRGAASRQHPDPSGGRQRAAAAGCDCRTPWDPPPPVLLVAKTKTGPVVAAVELPGPRAEIRELAERLLHDRGYSLGKGGWKDGRHTLLPPEGKLKTRPGLLADLGSSDHEGAYAVIDTPPEQGTGVHCPDCCRNFANAGAWQLHRRHGAAGQPRWRETCVDPACVVMVPSVMLAASGERNSPLLKRGLNGIWMQDPLAVWGPDGPPFTPEAAGQIHARGMQSMTRWLFGKGHNRAVADRQPSAARRLTGT